MNTPDGTDAQYIEVNQKQATAIVSKSDSKQEFQIDPKDKSAVKA